MLHVTATVAEAKWSGYRRPEADSQAAALARPGMIDLPMRLGYLKMTHRYLTSGLSPTPPSAGPLVPVEESQMDRRGRGMCASGGRHRRYGGECEQP